MIKTIKKIDIHGNETWQDVYACNRCKRTLEEDEHVYTTKWQSWFPVKPKRLTASGFSAGSNPDIHLCEKCSQAVQDFWNGKDLEKVEEENWSKRMARILVEQYRHYSSSLLREQLNNFMCSTESSQAIHMVLKERGEEW